MNSKAQSPYNKYFKLDLKDIELIESSIRNTLSTLDEQDKKELNQLLGKIHSQKRWYRPKGVYVGG